MIPLEHYIILSFALFAIGIGVVIMRKNAIMVLMGIELMLNAANINLVAFNQIGKLPLEGQMFALFVIVLAACEAAVALAIVVKVIKKYNTSDVDKISKLKE